MPAELEDPVPRQLSAARCIQITRICCGIVIAIVATVLVGWSVDSILLKSMLPAAVAMKPNAAIALCFSALSLLFFTRPATRGAQLQQKLSVMFAIAVAAIGALTLFEYLTGVSLGIDELLFRDSVRSASPIYPAGRMAPIAAFNFVCMGHALLLIHRPKWILHAQGLTAVAACGSLLAVIGYLFGVEMLYRSGYFSAIAVNTGVAFLALCTGLWFATSGVGFMRVVTASGPSGTLVRRYGVTVLVLPFLISWLHLQGDHYVWFEPDFGSALFALIDVVTFSLLIWFGASSLHRSEAKEAEVRERLRHARLELEDRVHERTRALETALHVNQQIMDYSLDVICIIDAEGRFTTVSAACEKVWGYTPAELIGRRFIELVHPDDHEKTNQTAAGIVTGETVRDFENRYLRKDGSSVFVTWSVYWSAEQKRMFCVARDATERKRAEEALHQAREDAERANRAKSEFLANMSHEIRTPMNGILGMTELTLDTELNREQREYLGMVKTSAHSLLGVINDILDFSKIEAGKLEMEALSFSLRDTVGTMLKPLGVRADEKDLELVADIPRDVPDHLIGDPMRLRQILLNLTDNAIKFTQRGEVIIKAAVESAADGESELHFSVTDSGIGIPAEKQATIFEAFSQVDGSTTRHYGGTGLGLAIATRLVQQMRGRIWVESQLGCGTTFHFTIWLRTSATPLPMVQQIDPAGLDGLRVLIVDDNAVNCRILEEMLTNWDMQPVVVRSAPAALTVMRAAVSAGNPFPLVLLDAMMPDMDGFALAASIKQEPSLASATVMMLSSAMRSGEISRASGMGIHSVLTKPVMQSELLNAILLALGSDEFAAAADAAVAPVPVATRHGQLAVLVAEDNLINRAVISGTLDRLGHTLTHAANGLEAIEAVRTTRFDLVLMDIQMPVMDGLEATARIREREKGTASRVPIVAMTAHAMAGDRERCLAAGMDDYVSKPIQREELQRVLGTINGGPARVRKEEANATVFSHADLLEQCDGDAELAEQLIELFRDDAPRLLDVIQAATARRDAAGVAAGAHKLVGSLGAFGAANARVIVSQLATATAAANFEQLSEQVEKLARELDLIQAILAGYLVSSGSLLPGSGAGLRSRAVTAENEYAAV